MGCNCHGKNKTYQVRYILTKQDGSQQTFSSRTEAEAANNAGGQKGTISKDRK